MKKINSTLVPLIILLLVCTNCTSNKNEDCPYISIEWSSETRQLKTENNDEVKLKIQGDLEGIIKKIGTGKGAVNVGSDFKNLSEEIKNSSISYDKEFVTNWNSLVADLCGKFFEIQRGQLPDSLQTEIEKSYCQRVLNFYELTFPRKTNQQELLNKNEKTNSLKKLENEIEISIQLPNSTKGYMEIFTNGKKAKISADSSPRNPRVIITSDDLKTQNIKIVTLEGDTCLLQRIFSLKKNETFPIRFTPICF